MQLEIKGQKCTRYKIARQKKGKNVPGTKLPGKKRAKMYQVQNCPKQKKEENHHEDDRNINYNSKHINIDITNNNAIGKYYKEKI